MKSFETRNPSPLSILSSVGRFRAPTLALLASAALWGCSSDDNEKTGLAQVPESVQSDVIATYAKIASATYGDTVSAAQDLDTAIDSFLAAPSEDGLSAARQAWRDARPAYLQTEVFRFYGGPIDNDESGPEGSLNAWPLDEAYIDYVVDSEGAGIVNDDSITLDADTLDVLNGGDGVDENVSTGYHAIEFLLWGQDQSDTGPGERPYTDYVVGGTAANQERRGQMLSVLSELMLEQLSSVEAEWKNDTENYRSSFESGDKKSAITNILTGMIILSGFETGGERLQAALDSGDQEQEHSCFSDNTHVDMIEDVRGVLNVYLGSYKTLDGETVSGAGVRDLVAAFDAELADRLEAKIRASLALAEDLDTPFDQSIALGNEAGRAKVSALVTSLREQAGLLEDVFGALQLAVPAAE